MLTAIGPTVMLFVRRISSTRPSRPIRSNSVFAVSMSPKPTAARVPMPPSFATAAARHALDTRTPIPPWMMGRGTVILPMVKGGIFMGCSYIS